MDIEQPEFQWSLLAPKYWGVWLGMGILYLVSWLPLSWQFVLGEGIGRLLAKVAKKRVAIAERNLALCFPDMPEAQRQTLVKDNIRYTGIALLETGMGWWWPDWRVRREWVVEGYEHVEAIQAQGKAVLGMAIHNLCVDFAARVVGLQKPSVAFYRRHDNPVIELLQYRGRSRSNKYMIHKRNVKGMIRAIKNGEVCFYLPDQDYGAHLAEFVPFFAVQETATTKGTLIFAKQKNCESVFVSAFRRDGKYVLKFHPGLPGFPSEDAHEDLTRLNQQVEKMVLEAPAQYLWMHKRFKTRPDERLPSLYDD